MSIATPLKTIAVGVVVERSKGAGAMDRFSVAAGCGLDRRAGHAALDQAVRRRRARDVLCRRGRDRTVSLGSRQLSRQSGGRDAAAVGGACGRAKAIRPITLAGVTADPAEGEALGRARQRSGRTVAMPEAVEDDRGGFRCRAPCRADVPQAQARPRRSGSAWRGARPQRRRASHERA